MKILQVIDQLNVGGAERVLVDMTNILHQRGENVTVLTLVRPGKLAAQLNSAVLRINLNRLNRFSLTKLFEINRICSRYDIVHVHLRYNFRYVALAKFIFRGSYKLLLQDHFGDIENDKKIPFGLKFFLRKNPWFSGVSKPLVEWAINSIGLKANHVFLLPNIIRRKQINQRNRPETPVINILLVSNFREAKNHSFACTLLSSLRTTMDFTASFVGQVIDIEFMNRIYKQIKENQLEDIVTIIHDCDDVQSLMHHYDLAIHTAYQESGPLVLIEYLAQQLPFVAFKTGEVSTQIHSLIHDFFMYNFDTHKWIERIKTVLSKREQYKVLMENAFHLLYSEEEYFKKCVGMYFQIMRNG
jgi:glycosyltransferase involved in cell wall biosynthesis